MTQWTDEQRTIIDEPFRSTVVIAAPGSGKTSVLTERIATVVRRDRIAPNRILAVTFTRQAAEHMRQKLTRHDLLTFRATESLRIGTFHAQIFRALLEVTPNIPVLLNTREQFTMMRTAMCRVVRKADEITHRAVIERLTEYSRVVGCGIRPASRESGRVFTAYTKLKRARNRWDYDDILLAGASAVEKGIDLPFFDRLQYLLVDEFQDTNAVQWALVAAMHHRYQIPIFVVGDDDQSVYGFRGASPGYLQRCSSATRDCAEMLLTHNFRSDTSIVHCAEQLIRHVAHRIDKPLRPVSQTPGLVRIAMVRDEGDEAAAVVALVRFILQIRPQATIGILARTRRQLYLTWRQMDTAVGGGANALNAVQFRTFHDSKGREWDVVVLLDLVVSRAVCRDAELDDDERRLQYVAMTRARYVLVGFVPMQMAGRKTNVAPFVFESGLEPAPLITATLMEEVENALTVHTEVSC
ncbi:UvrD-helicase domain-containing protein [Alicyclobacillus fastidiosus]|uniref:DNA 3'-5' helicase n=1 Tax=Alicyclobacillus fastidiosus TaxID=392011 RepID=A0ABV5AG34_9BACL|nr:ATP-dependent helicase [Alicyclobacillus fastidiosus]WEH11794.1 ATP-dependent helicase [Alicyclobacillus fastidiosus]